MQIEKKKKKKKKKAEEENKISDAPEHLRTSFTDFNQKFFIRFVINLIKVNQIINENCQLVREN